MFTGIIEEVGTVAAIDNNGIRVRCDRVLSDTTEGASIAVNGVCLTARHITDESFSADLAPETVRRTNLGEMRPGKLVNLERALLPTVRLSGHIVQGHVDGTGELIGLDETAPDGWWLRVRIPDDLDRYVVVKGSLCIDGISLTVADIDGSVASFAIIPHTYLNTALRDKRPGDPVNLETDVIAKYVEKMLMHPAHSTFHKGNASS